MYISALRRRCCSGLSRMRYHGRPERAPYRDDPLMPFANLEDADRRRKRHGIDFAYGPMPPRVS